MPELAEQMSVFAGGAVEVAANTYHIALDYSEESIAHLGKIFDSLHSEVRKGFMARLLKLGLTERQISYAALLLGAYVGEVIRRKHGGEWTHEDVMGEKDVVALHVNPVHLFPVSKAYKRIVNGSEDDIGFYYQALKLQLEKEESLA